MKIPAFRLYVQDFRCGTLLMSQAEIGSYILLLCYQWDKGRVPIEHDDQMCTIAGGPVTQQVKDKFPDGKNLRMEEERVKQADLSRNQKERADKRWHPSGNAGSMLSVSVSGSESASGSESESESGSNTVISPSLNHDVRAEESNLDKLLRHVQEHPLTPPPNIPRNEKNGAAHIIYGLYPRKVAKPEALRAIEKALLKVDKAFLMERTRAYAEAVRGTNLTFIPHPAKWYTEERFNDGPETWVRQEDAKPAPRGTSFGGNKLD